MTRENYLKYITKNIFELRKNIDINDKESIKEMVLLLSQNDYNIKDLDEEMMKLSKDYKEKRKLQMLANKIREAKKEIQKNENIEKNKELIKQITLTLSFEELLKLNKIINKEKGII